MEWLVSFKRTLSPAEVQSILDRSGSMAGNSPPVPLGEDEQVVSVSGPPDLPRRLGGDDRVLKISPNSTMTLY
jgi:hypothetical protein